MSLNFFFGKQLTINHLFITKHMMEAFNILKLCLHSKYINFILQIYNIYKKAVYATTF